jgi:hypothetical protein
MPDATDLNRSDLATSHVNALSYITVNTIVLYYCSQLGTARLVQSTYKTEQLVFATCCHNIGILTIVPQAIKHLSQNQEPSLLVLKPTEPKIFA